MNVYRTHVRMVDNVCRHSMQVMYAAVLQAILVSTAQKVKIFLVFRLQIPWAPVSHFLNSFFRGCSIFCLKASGVCFEDVGCFFDKDKRQFPTTHQNQKLKVTA